MNLLAGRRHRERSCRHREERVWWPGKLALTFMYNVCVRAKSRQSCPTLREPVDCSPPASSVHGILLASILDWVAMTSSRSSSWPRDRTRVSYVSCIGRRVLYHQHHLGSPRLSSAPILMLLPAPRLPVFVKLKGSVKKTQKAGVIIHKVLDVVEGALEPYGWAGISVLALTS